MIFPSFFHSNLFHISLEMFHWLLKCCSPKKNIWNDSDGKSRNSAYPPCVNERAKHKNHKSLITDSFNFSRIVDMIKLSHHLLAQTRMHRRIEKDSFFLFPILPSSASIFIWKFNIFFPYPPHYRLQHVCAVYDFLLIMRNIFSWTKHRWSNKFVRFLSLSF